MQRKTLEPMSLDERCEAFFGHRQREAPTGSDDEVNALGEVEKEELIELFNAAGLPTDIPKTGEEECVTPAGTKERSLYALPRLVSLDHMGEGSTNGSAFKWIRDEIMGQVIESECVWPLLTEEPKQIARFFDWWGRPAPLNCWLGTRVTSQAEVRRIDALRGIRCSVRFVSFRPLQGDVTNAQRTFWPR